MDSFDRFIAAAWRQFKFLATEPAVSLGEIVGLLAILAYRPPHWLVGIVMLAWLFWRNERTASVDTLPEGQDAKQGLAGTEGSAVGGAETPRKPTP